MYMWLANYARRVTHNKNNRQEEGGKGSDPNPKFLEGLGSGSHLDPRRTPTVGFFCSLMSGYGEWPWILLKGMCSVSL